jgi:tetratricopeptide (TPR) repeat protein
MMNLKKKYAGQSRDFGPGFWLFTLGLLFLIAESSLADEDVTFEHLDPIIFLAANQGTDAALQKNKTAEQKISSKPSISDIFSSEPAHRLWQAEVAAPAGQKDDKDEEAVLQLIEQLRSVESGVKKQPAQPVAEVTPRKPDEEQVESKLLSKPLAKQTLQMAEDLLKHPEQIDSPLELGEILFLSGHLPQAAVAYQEALKRTEPNSVALAKDRSWILFQVGNCLRADDPATAAKMYRQLISGYPHSQWTEAAKAQDQLAEWYQKDNPKTLIAGDNH